MNRLYLVVVFLFAFNVLALGQTQPMVSAPGPVIICPSGEFDGHHYTPVPAEIMQKILQKDGSEPCANITVVYTGFTTQAQIAFQAAVDIWAYSLSSSVTIEVEANWESLAEGVLGYAGPTQIFKNFQNAPTDDYYPVALANHMAGLDLLPGISDIQSSFNSNFDWYYGTDGNAPNDKYDLMTVVLHELGHGFGFSSYSSYNQGNNTGSFGTVGDNTPLYFDRFLVSSQNGSGLIGLSGTALGNAFTSDNVFCNSAAATAILGGNQPKMYAPSSFSTGSSMSHWDETVFPSGNVHSLMTPHLTPGEAIHNPGPITLALFEDMGWTLCSVLENDPCVTWQDPSPTTGWNDFNDQFGGAPCDDGSGCPFNEIQQIQVNAGEAYSVDGFIAGGEYSFSICNGPDAGSWIPEFTIIAPSGAVDAAGSDTECAISWTASESGTYVIVINQEGNCGATDASLNGYPALTCESGTAICPPATCATEILVITGDSEICSGETTTVSIINPPIIPAGGGYAIDFYNPTTQDGITFTGVTLPYTFDNDLNGLLTQFGFDLFEGEYELTGVVYADANDIEASICAVSNGSAIVNFLSATDPACLDEEDCATETLVVTGASEICPGLSTTVNLVNPATIPPGGGYAIDIYNEALDNGITITGVSLPYIFDNDLNGLLTANGLDLFEGEYEFTGIVYADANDIEGSICAVSTGSVIVNFLSATDPACLDEVICATETLVVTGDSEICLGATTSVNLINPASIPAGGGYAINFYNPITDEGGTISEITFPFTFDNDLNGVLSENGFDLFEGEYELTGIVYTDTADFEGSICAISTGVAIVNFLSASDPACAVDACLTWQDPSPGTGWTNFNSAFGGAPCDDGTGCPFNEIQSFQVNASEAYTVNGFITGGEYTFSICNGPDAGSWVPDFTIIAPSGAVDAAGGGTGCAISWTASESGTYLIVINQAGNCGIINSANNGYPALTCEGGTAICEPSICSTEPLQTADETSLCPGETVTVNLSNPASIPEGGGYAINFHNTTTEVGLNLTGVTLPFTFDNDLNGVLSDNGFELFEGEYELTGIVYSDLGNFGGSVCAMANDVVTITFLPASDPACSDVEICLTETLVLTGYSEICPGETTTVNLTTPATIPAGGGYAINFYNVTTEVGGTISEITLPFTFDNDLNGVLSANGFDLFEGEYELIGIVYADTADFEGSICAVATGAVTINFLSATDPACLDEEPCATGTLVVTGDSEICPGETTTVTLNNSASIPAGGGYAIEFYNPATDDGFTLTDITLPFTFDSDLNGLLSQNGMDLFEGEYEVTGIVYSDANDIDESICAVSSNTVIVNFLSETAAACSGEDPCATGTLVVTDISEICPNVTTTVNLTIPASIPAGGGYGINFSNTVTGGGITLTGVILPYTFNNDINGLLSANGIALFEGEYELTGIVYSDANNIAGSICETAPGAAIVTFLSASDPACSSTSDDCLTWQYPSPTGGYNDFNTIFGGAPCDDGTGCPFNEIQTFQVNASEAYAVSGFIAGGEYTFSICNGPDAGSWVPDFTIIAPSGAVVASGSGTGCAISWTATESGTYLIVINQEGNCGIANAANNGFPALTCVSGTAMCEEAICATGSLQGLSETILCPGETTTVNLINAATIPAGGGYAIDFYNPSINSGITLTGVTLPFTFDNNLNGLLTANGYDVFEGEYELTGIVYSDASNVGGSFCATASDVLIVTFLPASNPACVDDEPCVTETLIATGNSEICPNQTATVNLISPATIPAGGGYAINFYNPITEVGGTISDVTLPFTFDNDLNGMLSANGFDLFEGEYELIGIVYSDLADFSGSICATSSGVLTINFLSASDPACSGGGNCATETLVLTGGSEVCPGDTTTVNLINPATIPAGGGYAIDFRDPVSNNVIRYSGIALPFAFDNDLNGFASANGHDLLEGEYELTGIVYADANDVDGSVCTTSGGVVTVNFLLGSNPACVTGIDEIESNGGFVVFPNPASDFVTLKLNNRDIKNASFRIMDMGGRILFEETHLKLNGDNTYQMDVSNLAQGVYFVVLSSEHGIKTNRLVIAK